MEFSLLQFLSSAEGQSLLAALFVAFLLLVVAGWVGIFAVVVLTIGSWRRSRILEIELRGAMQSGISSFFGSGFRAGGELTARVSGSSNSNGEERRTSIASPTDQLTDAGSPKHGTSASGREMSDTFEPGHELSGYGLEKEARLHTQENMPPSSIKKICRPCTKIRDLVDSGVSWARGRSWRQPRE